jgi:glycine dehydrogenase subunit 1
MDYIPHTTEETYRMLRAVGLEHKEDLFAAIPCELRDPEIALPPPSTEMDITREMESAAKENRGSEMVVFAGGGAYDHFIPQAVHALIGRGDFLTAYTPYQPEASQGTLQAIYEFQSLICRLTGMEVCNASMYDAATGLAEAALMACRITQKETIIVSSTINPRYRRVLHTYMGPPGIEVIEIPHDGGATDLAALRTCPLSDVAAVFVQNPNYYGILEQVGGIAEAVRDARCLLGVVVYPHSLGLLKSPGEWGADLVVGDLQSLGLPLNYGGPYAGFIATRQTYVRQLPGRLAGRTRDKGGTTGYVLTLQTREQQIRRAKATSNICTNQALCALAATVYLSLLGAKGLRRAAELSVRKAHRLQARLSSVKGVRTLFNRPFFNEFLLDLPVPVSTFLKKACEENLLAGVRVPPGEATERETLLVCATEKNDEAEIQRYAEILGRVAAEIE